jgi:hypothetical protein
MFKLHVTDADVSDALETEQTADTDSCITFTRAVMVTGEQSSDDIDTVVVYVLLLYPLGIVTGTLTVLDEYGDNETATPPTVNDKL